MIAIQDELAIKRAKDLGDKPETSEEMETSSRLWSGLPKVMRWVMGSLVVILVVELIFIILK